MGGTFSGIGTLILATGLAVGLAACDRPKLDEAAQIDLKPEHFRHAGLHDGVDYFAKMDGGLPLSEAEAKGRVMWLLWTGGNDRFWDHMVKPTFGTFDLLKFVAAPPGSPNARPNRWKYLGLVNEPCFTPARTPDRFGLYIDHRDPKCGADPFADEKLYPGVRIGARGKMLPDGKPLPVGSYYGEPTGIFGLRLFPNPDFDEKAYNIWMKEGREGKAYYDDPAFFGRQDLVRPYRVGMSCGFCHVGPIPTNPPKDPENPQWENLSSTVGAQYMWVDRLFYWNWHEQETGKAKRSFLYEWVKTFRPGAMDTSLVSTDNINNPRTMNAIYHLMPRLEMGKKIGQEKLAGGGMDNMQFNHFVKEGPLAELFDGKDGVSTPRVLKDGSDSVGALGALNRVYLNIGLYSEEWLTHFNAVVGGKTVTPISIETARANSPYWRATEQGTVNTALFFLKAAQPDYLAASPGGAAFLNAPPAQLARGRQVFADTCARCHSSKGPVPPKGVGLADSTGPGYLEQFKKWWRWTQTPQFKQAMRAEVEKPDFVAGNYLSTEARIPVTLLRTNLCSPLATNAIKDNIWDNFSSESYKSLPSVGTVSYSDPYTGGRIVDYRMPDGGRGYTRVPSLVSLWSTAPYLLNNTVGEPLDRRQWPTDPGVATRMASFDTAIRELLWPERRPFDVVNGHRLEGRIDRTTARSNIFIPRSYLPIPETFQNKVRKVLGLPKGQDLEIGPVPRGTPVNALANLQPRAEGDVSLGARRSHLHRLIDLLGKIKQVLLGGKDQSDEQMLAAFRSNEIRNELNALSKCPDFVVNRGHYFGTAQFNQDRGLSADEQAWGKEPPLGDEDKEALIAFLKTL